MLKNLIAIISLAAASASFSAEQPRYHFEFNDQADGMHLQNDVHKMVYIGETVKWALLATWDAWPNDNDVKIMHSATVFKNSQKTDINQVQFDQIYTYGYIECGSHRLHILNEFYTDGADNLIVLSNRFSASEYIVNLDANIILQTLWHYACRGVDV